jgi:hypothetical protein
MDSATKDQTQPNFFFLTHSLMEAGAFGPQAKAVKGGAAVHLDP